MRQVRRDCQSDQLRPRRSAAAGGLEPIPVDCGSKGRRRGHSTRRVLQAPPSSANARIAAPPTRSRRRGKNRGQRRILPLLYYLRYAHPAACGVPAPWPPTPAFSCRPAQDDDGVPAPARQSRPSSRACQPQAMAHQLTELRTSLPSQQLLGEHATNPRRFRRSAVRPQQCPMGYGIVPSAVL